MADPSPFFDRLPHLRDVFGSVLPLAPLGPGQPNERCRNALAKLDDRTLFAGQTVRDENLARCCHSGLWLAFDFLDESHRISQEIETVEGSYWHGIMHRREPDYGNAKYWFRRVPRHPVFESLAEAARDLASQQGISDPHAQFLLHQHTWDPARFVDLCQAVAQGRARCDHFARQVAQIEWQQLFQYCYEGATS